MGHVSPVYLSHLVNELRRNEAAKGLDKIFGNPDEKSKLGYVPSVSGFFPRISQNGKARVPGPPFRTVRERVGHPRVLLFSHD